MKGSPCQAAKDVQSKSNEDQNSWTDTSHEHYDYDSVDKLSVRLLFLSKVDKAGSKNKRVD